MSAIVCPELGPRKRFHVGLGPKLGKLSHTWAPHPPNSKFPNLAPNGPGTPNIGFLGSVRSHFGSSPISGA